MPLYEYQCEACDHRFEVIQKFSDPLVTVCSACGGAVRKLFSSPAIQFKGSGFYITDYAKKNSPSGTGSKGESSSAGSNGKDGGSTKSGSSDSGSSGSSGDSGGGTPASGSSKTTKAS